MRRVPPGDVFNRRGRAIDQTALHPAGEVRVVPRSPVDEEAEQLLDDIEIVRVMIDAALDNGLDHRLVDACTSVLRERRERLEELELAGSSRAG